MSVFRRVGMKLLKGVLAFQVWLYRRTRGRRAGSIRGTPVLLLTTTGRHSGERGTRPVRGVRLQRRLKSVSGMDVEAAVTAIDVTGAEYEHLWQQYVAAYPGFAKYQAKTTRHLPIFILTGAPT